VGTSRAGYSGSGYAVVGGRQVDTITWTVTGAAGTASVLVRYGNSSGDPVPGTLSVNGATTSLSLADTGTGWRTATVTVTLRAGTNTVKLAAGGGDGGHADIDYLSVTQ